MIDYAVDDLDALVTRLQAKGIEILKRGDDANGRFAWVLDPEGNKIELWEPKRAAAAKGAVKGPYPTMAPVEQYRIADRQVEIALARSAAPPSISADAEVLVLGDGGYEVAVLDRGLRRYPILESQAARPELLQSTGCPQRIASVHRAHEVGPGRSHQAANHGKSSRGLRSPSIHAAGGWIVFLHAFEGRLRERRCGRPMASSRDVFRAAWPDCHMGRRIRGFAGPR
jgi:hypothetical protein